MTPLSEVQLLAESQATARVDALACEVVTDFRRLSELSTGWDRLWESDPESEFFQSFAWARAWWNSFGEGLKLFVPVVYEDGEVALILPLVQSRRKLRFLGSPEADYSDILCSRRRSAFLLSFGLTSALKSIPEWTECILDHLHPDSHIVRAWVELPDDLRRLMRLELADSCPTIVLGEKRDEVIDSLLAGKHLRRRLNKLQKAGAVTFRHLENVDEAHEQLALFFRSHRRRCALLAKTSCFERGEMRALMRTLVTELDLRKELRFGTLEWNGRPVAWSIGFQTGGKYSYYQQTFDVDAEEFAPGEVLLRFLLSYAKQSVEREFDFLRGDEFFKKRFATQVNQNRCLYFQRPGVGGHLRNVGRILQGRVTKIESRIENFVRTRESVFHIFRSLGIWRRARTRRLQWANAHGELSDYLLGSFREWLRGVVWNKRVTTLFQKEDSTVPVLVPACLVSDPQIDVAVGQLSDLADLALEHPGIPFPGFREYRNRLKNGDRVYLVYQNGQLSLVAWTGLRPVDQPSQISEASGAPACSSALAMYECWPIQNPWPGCMQLLSTLAAGASGKSDLLVSCPSVPTESRAALERGGFLAKSQLVHYSLFRSLRHQSVHPCAACEEQQSQDGSCPKLREGTKS